MSRGLLLRLVLPLLAVFGLAVFAHTCWPADGFFLNLATEIIGIGFTVGYVDWVLRKHRQEEWHPADARIGKRLRVLLNRVIAGIRDGLRHDYDLMDSLMLLSHDPIRMHKETLRLAVDVMAPTIAQRVRSLDQDGWTTLAVHISDSREDIKIALTFFQNRLRQDQVAYLLDLEEALASSLAYYHVFPELTGVAKDRSPKTKSAPEQLQRVGCDIAIKCLHRAVDLARRLSETLD